MFLSKTRTVVVALSTCLALSIPVWADGTPRKDIHKDVRTDDTRLIAQSIIAIERDDSHVMQTLEYLSDQIGPRLTGSDRMKRANEWTAEQMKASGLENVHLEEYTIPRGWERGPVEAKILPTGLSIPAVQMAWTPGTKGKITAPVVLLTADSEEGLAAYRGKLKGAIILVGKPPVDTLNAGSIKLPNAQALPPIKPLVKETSATATPEKPFDFQKYMAFRRKLGDFLKDEGVAAVLRDSDKPHMLLNMTGSWDPKWGAQPYSVFFIAHEHVALIQRLAAQNIPVSLELKADAKFTNGPVKVYNTVGEIRGSDKPEEIVAIGAHLDSWDLGTGTTDNGTGSSAVLEAGRALKLAKARPSRTIRFILFSGEEEGLCGSVAYVEAHKKEMPNYSVVFVHDTGTGRVQGAWMQERAEAQSTLESQFSLVNELGLTASAPNLMPGKMNGTDHASFDDAGVPAFAFNQDGAEYGLTHHSQSDTFDKARPEDLKQGACVLAIFAYQAAQMPEKYPRKK